MRSAELLSKYGEDKGEFYSYVLTAVRRASQNLGRAIRSSEDRAASSQW